MTAERTELMYKVIPIYEVLSEMVERYGFSRDGGGGWIAGVWRGFPVLISSEDVEEINSLEVTMGVGEKLPPKDSLREVHASPQGTVDVDLFPQKGFLRFIVRFKNHTVRNSDKALGFLCLLLNAVADSCNPPPRTCGWCGERQTDELTIDRGKPRRMCGSCLEAYASEVDGKSKADPDFFWGILLGAAGALGTGVIWALLLHYDHTVLLFLFTPFVGIVVARMVLWGMGRGDIWAYILSGLFSMVAGVFGVVMELVWRASVSLGTWDTEYGLDEIILWISENRGEALSLGIYISISVAASITTMNQLLLPQLKRVAAHAAHGSQAEKEGGL